MKILLVTGSYPPMPCGMGDYVACLARALAKVPGTQIGVLTGKAALEPSPAIRLFARMDAWRLRDLGRVDRTIAEFGPDLVHLQYPSFGYAGQQAPLLTPLLAWRHGARAVRTLHEWAGLRTAPAHLLQSLAPGGYIVVRADFIARLPRALRPFARGRRCAFIAGASAIPPTDRTPAEIATLRARYLGDAERLIAFFGFVYPDKGTDLLFQIADSARDRLLIVGKVVDFPYTRAVAAIADSEPWRGRVTYTGFVPPAEAAALLAAADAVVLPFRDGGGNWNSSLTAALAQGTPVVTTSRQHTGLDEARLIAFCPPGDIPAMRAALDTLAGRRRPVAPADDWARIADQHIAFYRACLE